MKISSPDFIHHGKIPKKFTCQGEDISPTLVIEDIPLEAKTLVLIIDDPDAPVKTWIHWVLFNIPFTEDPLRIEEGTAPGHQGINDFKKMNYGGPCPPSGIHRYFFKVYALDDELPLSSGCTLTELKNAMQNHILDQAELIGLYEKG